MNFSQFIGMIPAERMAELREMAADAKWRDIRQYSTAEVANFWEPSKRAFFIRIPPGAKITPHRDSVPGVTHHLVLQTNPHCVNGWLDGEQPRTEHLSEGNRYEVSRDVVHWAENNGDTDRIHLLVEFGNG